MHGSEPRITVLVKTYTNLPIRPVKSVSYVMGVGACSLLAMSMEVEQFPPFDVTNMTQVFHPSNHQHKPCA
jgi:hypothetical protein